jgi:thioredoxin reductase
MKKTKVVIVRGAFAGLSAAMQEQSSATKAHENPTQRNRDQKLGIQT